MRTMLGPLTGAKGSLCQQGTDIKSVSIWYYILAFCNSRGREPGETRCRVDFEYLPEC